MMDTAVTHQELSESTWPIASIFFNSTILAYPGSIVNHLAETSTNNKQHLVLVAMFLTTEFSVNSTVHTTGFENSILTVVENMVKS